MDGWHLALYAFAVYAAVRILIGLMRAHEIDLKRTLAAENEAAEVSPKPPGDR